MTSIVMTHLQLNYLIKKHNFRIRPGDIFPSPLFCTNLTGKAHKIIADYDKRADVENLVGEAKREGLDMIPSAKFKNDYTFFHIVMLPYNVHSTAN
jgi:hypothetical protein